MAWCVPFAQAKNFIGVAPKEYGIAIPVVNE
jgi:hypothetical protein